MGSYFDTYASNWESVAKRRRVDLRVENKLKEPVSIRAFAIDFDTVFNNLLVNSFDSFKRRKDAGPRTVKIEVAKTINAIEITFSDNGAGLVKDYQKNPEEIFLPFETSKIDRKGEKIGTGMGMYLVKSIIDEYKGTINITKMENGFAVQILLPLRKD